MGKLPHGEKVTYRGQREVMEDRELKSNENYYIEETLTNGARCGFSRTEMKSTKYASWKEDYKTTGEIAIDRMYADNNSLKIGTPEQWR